MPATPNNHDAHDYAERIREQLHKGRCTFQQKILSEKPTKQQRGHRCGKLAVRRERHPNPNPNEPMKTTNSMRISFLAGALALAGLFAGQAKAQSPVKIDLAYNVTTTTNARGSTANPALPSSGGAASPAAPVTARGILLRGEQSIPSTAVLGAEAYGPVALIQFETLNVVPGSPGGPNLPRVQMGFRLQVSQPQFIERDGVVGLEGGMASALLSLGSNPANRTANVVEKLINNSASRNLPFAWEEVRGAAVLRAPYKGARVRWFAQTLTTADVRVEAIAGATAANGNPVPGTETRTMTSVTLDPALSARLAGLEFNAAVKLVVSDLIGRGFVNLDGGEVGIMRGVPSVQ
jgi:hypothetical protein